MKKLAASLTLGALLFAACGGGSTPDSMSTEDGDHGAGAAACSSSGTSLSVTTKDTKFDKECLAVDAGQAFTIELINQDDFPHNVSIYKDPENKDRIYEGKPLAEGMKTVTYEVPAISEKGTYHFMCDIHPEMEGTFVVS